MGQNRVAMVYSGRGAGSIPWRTPHGPRKTMCKKLSRSRTVTRYTCDGVPSKCRRP